LGKTYRGDLDFLVCASCGYAADQENVAFVCVRLPDEDEAALEEVYAPG
jgi:hypothetical protein